MLLSFFIICMGLINPGDLSHRRGRTLNGTALHKVTDPSQSSHFFASSGSPRTAVNQCRQRRTVAGTLFGTLPIDTENPTVMRRRIDRIFPCDSIVIGKDG